MPTNSYFEIKQKEPWLYSIKDRMEVYCWLLLGEDSALLLDAGYGVGDLPAAVKSITGKPLTVVLSHGHADHALGANQFEHVLLHHGDFEIYSEHSGAKWRGKAVEAITKNKAKIGPCIDGFDSDAYMTTEAREPKRLEENAVFDLGGLTAAVIPMGGHTPGSIGLFIPEHKTLMTGDAANRATFLFLTESLRMPEYLQMLRKVTALDFSIHYTGHQETAYPSKWFDKYIKVAENALAGKGRPMKIPGFEEYGEILVSAVGGPMISPKFCAVGYTKEKLILGG